MADESKWVDALPEDVREWQEAKASDSPEKFWQQMTEMRGRLGNSIRIPSEEAGEADLKDFYQKLGKVNGVTAIPGNDDPESWGAFYDKAGRPATADEYSFDSDKDTKDFYHGLGLSDAQGARLVEARQERNKSTAEQSAATIKEEFTSLQTEWGEAAPRKMAGIKAVLGKYDKDGKMAEALADPTFKHASALLRTLGTMGDEFVERSPPAEGSGVAGWGVTPEEAKERANDMLHNPDSPRNNPGHPNHATAQKEYMRLRHIASGESRA